MPAGSTEIDLDGPFDGAFSNFGALNCVPDLAAVSAGAFPARPFRGPRPPLPHGPVRPVGVGLVPRARRPESGVSPAGNGRHRVARSPRRLSPGSRAAPALRSGVSLPRRPCDRRSRPAVLRRGVDRAAHPPPRGARRRRAPHRGRAPLPCRSPTTSSSSWRGAEPWRPALPFSLAATRSRGSRSSSSSRTSGATAAASCATSGRRRDEASSPRRRSARGARSGAGSGFAGSS